MPISKYNEFVPNFGLELEIKKSEIKQEIIKKNLYELIKNEEKYNQKKIEDIYFDIFGVEYKGDDFSQMLRLYSYFFINKQKNLSLVNYLKDIGLNSDYKTRKQVFEEIFPNEKYKGTSKQNLELFHFLLKQIELQKLFNNYKIILGSKSNQEILKKDIENQKENKDKKQELIIEKENKKEKNTDIKELIDYNKKVKNEIIKDFGLNKESFRLKYERISGGVKYKDNLEVNLELYALLYISKNPITLDEFMQNERIKESRKILYKKYFPQEYKEYKGTLEQNRKLYNKLVIEKKISTNQEKNDLNNALNKDKEIKNNKIFNILDPKKIRSSGIEKSPKGIRLCSKTARINLQKFGVDKPERGDSIKIMKNLLSNGKGIEFNSVDNLKNHLLSQLNKGNVFDIYRNTKNGHRFVVFGGLDNKGKVNLFILDPYYSNSGINPILFDDYFNKSRIKFDKIVLNNNIYKVNSKYEII